MLLLVMRVDRLYASNGGVTQTSQHRCAVSGSGELASFKQALTACHSDIRRGRRPKTLNKAAKDSGQAETSGERSFSPES